MIVQSHAGSIHLLPALPSNLPEGRVKGLRARGLFEVALTWSNGKLKSVTIESFQGGPCELQYGKKRFEFETVAGQQYRFDGSLKQI